MGLVLFHDAFSKQRTIYYYRSVLSVRNFTVRVRNDMCKTESFRYVLARDDSQSEQQEYQFDNTHNITNHVIEIIFE